MNFKIKAKDFQKLGNDVMKGYVKSDKTVLAMKVSKTLLKILCYSPSTYFEGKVKIMDMEDLDDSWKILDGDGFKSFLSILPKDDTIINFSTTALGDFVLKYGRNKVNLNLKETIDDTPIKEERKFVEIVDVDAVSFMTTLKDMSKIVSKDKNKEHSSLSFLHMFFNEDNITMMATQSISIAEFIYKIDSPKIVDDYVLLKGSFIDLLDTTLTVNDTWTLIKTKSKFGYKNNNGFIALIAIASDDIKPIKYTHLKNLTAKKEDLDYNSIMINSISLKDTLANIFKISPNDPSAIFHFTKEGLFLETPFGDKFEVESSYDQDKDIKFGVNKEALKCLYSIWSPNIEMIFKDDVFRNVIEFKILDGQDNVLDNIFIGVSPDDQ